MALLGRGSNFNASFSVSGDAAIVLFNLNASEDSDPDSVTVDDGASHVV